MMNEALNLIVENWQTVSGLAVLALPRYISRPITEIPQLVWEATKQEYNQRKGGKGNA